MIGELVSKQCFCIKTFNFVESYVNVKLELDSFYTRQIYLTCEKSFLPRWLTNRFSRKIDFQTIQIWIVVFSKHVTNYHNRWWQVIFRQRRCEMNNPLAEDSDEELVDARD